MSSYEQYSQIWEENSWECKGRQKKVNERINKGDGEDRKCCFDEVFGDRASTKVEVHLFTII